MFERAGSGAKSVGAQDAARDRQSGAGVEQVRGLLERGVLDPTPIADAIRANPDDERAIFALLHGTLGNAFTQQVITALGSTSASPTAAPAHTAKRDVAEAPKEEKLNAALRVLVYSGDRVVRRWDTKGHWEGPLPVTFTAHHSKKGWDWDDDNGRFVRVNTNARGSGGTPVEAWAGEANNADRIVVYAQPIDAVTIDKDAERTEAPPGNAKTKEESGDGSTTDVKPGKSGAGQGNEESTTSGAPSQATSDGKTPDASGGGGQAVDGEGDDVDVDAFEQSIGMEPDSDESTTTGPTAGGDKKDGRGQAGGGQDSRTGKDADVDGSGPGGANSKAGGIEEGGQEDAESNDGTEHGDKDGAKLGSEHGEFDGKGSDSDHGVRGAVALKGGFVAIPAALRGLVELILLWGQGDITGATSDAVRAGVGKFANAAAARRVLASEARKAAAVETRQLMKRLANNKEWKALSAAERKQVARAAYWEVQRSYYQAYIRAAKQAQREAKAALRNAKTTAAKTAAMEQKKAADTVVEAGNVQPVAARLPRNHEYAGKEFPRSELPAKYRAQGLRFKENGYPDFSPYAMELPKGGKSVTITLTGSMKGDIRAANREAGLLSTPRGYTWHHLEDVKTMELIPTDLHLVGHTGGQAGFKHATGVEKYGD